MISIFETAFLTAYYRSLESEREDALFHDPWALPLAGRHGKSLAQEWPLGEMTAKIIAVRTRIIDDFIQAAVLCGTDAVINLGAGLDTRPYRMNLPKTLTWVEADYPQMIAFKHAELARETASCQVKRLAIDIDNRDALRWFLEEAVRRRNNVLVLTEGILSYMRNEEVGYLADSLRALPAVTHWIVDYFSHDATPIRPVPYRFLPLDWFEFFESHGWVPEKIHYLIEEAERLRRPLEVETQNDKLVGFALLKRLA